MSSVSSITMQKEGEEPIKITLEDAVIIMTNQQKTIEQLIENNQRMFSFIEEARKTGNFNNINIERQGIPNPIENINSKSTKSNTNLPNTLSPAPTPTPTPSSINKNDPPMTLSEFLANKNKNKNEKIDEVPIFDIPSKI